VSCRYSGYPTVALMEIRQSSYVYIPYAITISKHERFTIYISLNALDSSTSHRILTSVHKSHFPRFYKFLMYFHSISFHIKSHIAHMKKII